MTTGAADPVPAASRGEDLLVPYRLRTVRIGVIAQLAAVILLGVVPLAGVPGWDLRLYYAGLAAGFLGVVAVGLLPWRTMFDRGWGMPAMYAWSIADIVIIAVLVVASGGHGTPLWAVFVLTTVFFAASYPLRSQALLLGLTFAAYAAALGATGTLQLDGAVLTHVMVLAVVAYMASFLSRELMGQLRGHTASRDLAQRRADQMESVLAAARRIHDLDPDTVLHGVADAAAQLGYESAAVASIEDGRTQVTLSVGPGDILAWERYDISEGPVADMFERDRTVVATLDPEGPMGRVGMRTVIVSPIRVAGATTAFLGVATARQETTHDALAAQPLELLAEVAGRALENAQLFEAEQRAFDELRQLDALKSDFISNASHELRTPIAVVFGFAESLTQHWERLDEATRKDITGRMLAASETLKRTVATLMDVSRLETDHIALEPQPFEVAALVAGVIDELSEILDAHRVAVDVTPTQINGDPRLLERALENLLINASKYTPPGTNVNVRGRVEGRVLRLTVADDGPGVPADELARLTDRFFRGGEQDSRSQRGLGLGLWFVDKVARSHGGRLDVHSVHGQGATFTLSVPVDANVVQQSPAPGSGTVRQQDR